MRTTVARYIDASEDAIEKIAKVFDCTPKFVYMCLTYRKGNETARKIRYTAVKEYGATPMCHYPECETLFTTEIEGEQYMRQAFNNGAVLLWHKGTPEVTVRYRDKEEVFHCESLPQFSEIQLYAESL